MAGALAPAQGQAPPFGLALPTASTGPDPLAHQGLYASASATAGAMESDDEWDEILAQPDRPTPLPEPNNSEEQMFTISIDEDADADDGLDFLERELLGEDEPAGDRDGDGDEELEEDQEDMMMVPATGHVSRVGGGAGTGGPMSMNQFVGGDAAVEDDDDDYSSSEESEED
jgi:hypothetical protein